MIRAVHLIFLFSRISDDSDHFWIPIVYLETDGTRFETVNCISLDDRCIHLCLLPAAHAFGQTSTKFRRVIHEYQHITPVKIPFTCMQRVCFGNWFIRFHLNPADVPSVRVSISISISIMVLRAYAVGCYVIFCDASFCLRFFVVAVLGGRK
jgi:hypothetical protein